MESWSTSSLAARLRAGTTAQRVRRPPRSLAIGVINNNRPVRLRPPSYRTTVSEGLRNHGRCERTRPHRRRRDRGETGALRTIETGADSVIGPSSVESAANGLVAGCRFASLEPARSHWPGPNQPRGAGEGEPPGEPGGSPPSPVVIVPKRENTVRKPEEPRETAQSNTRGFAFLRLCVNSDSDFGPRMVLGDEDVSRGGRCGPVGMSRGESGSRFRRTKPNGKRQYVYVR